MKRIKNTLIKPKGYFGGVLILAILFLTSMSVFGDEIGLDEKLTNSSYQNNQVNLQIPSDFSLMETEEIPDFDSNRILLIQETLPWRSNANTEVLESLGFPIQS